MTTPGVNARNDGLAAVQLAYPDQISAGLDVVRRWAATGRRFSINDVRDELDRLGVHGRARGQVFSRANRERLITEVGRVHADDPAARGRKVPEYVGRPEGEHVKPTTNMPTVADWARQRSAERSRRGAVSSEVVEVPVRRNHRGQFDTHGHGSTDPTLFDQPIDRKGP